MNCLRKHFQFRDSNKSKTIGVNGWLLRKPFEGLSGHGSSFKKRAKPETEQALANLGQRLRVFEITHPLDQ